jgi:hypothetical protein
MENKLSIPSTWILPAEITSRLGATVGRQRLMHHEGHILLILHKVPDADSRLREPALFYYTPLKEWKTTVGSGTNALGKFLTEYETVLESLDRKLDNAATAQDCFQVIAAANPIVRATNHLHEVLQAARELLKTDKQMITNRDTAYDLKRQAELLMEEARNKLDYEIARRSEEEALYSREQARAAHKLNLLAAVFFPVTAVSSILGANMPMGLENAPSALIYWVLIIIALFVGLNIRNGMIGAELPFMSRLGKGDSKITTQSGK